MLSIDMPRTKKPKHVAAGVYRITHDASGKTYVGKSINVQKRWTRHKWELNLGTHGNRHLQRAWIRDGEASFTFEIIVLVGGLEGDALDKALSRAEIDALRSFSKTYNLMEAGNASSALSASLETRELWSAQRKEMWSDPDYKDRLSRAQTAVHSDPAFRERRRKAIIEVRSTVESRARTSRQVKAMWEPGGIMRETQAEKTRASWADPVYRAKQSEARKRCSADPTVKARRSAGLRLAWARRKAEKETPPV